MTYETKIWLKWVCGMYHDLLLRKRMVVIEEASEARLQRVHLGACRRLGSLGRALHARHLRPRRV